MGSPLVEAMTMSLAQKISFEPPAIPDRLYFKIGDVARICEVETYVLRFWESQFPQLKPNKSGTGQRLYRRRDVELALEIKRLVHGEGYTLTGARQVLEQGNRRSAVRETQGSSEPQASRAPKEAAGPAASEPGLGADSMARTLAEVRAGLREIAGLLAEPPAPVHPQVVRRRPRLAAVHAHTGSLFPPDPPR